MHYNPFMAPPVILILLTDPLYDMATTCYLRILPHKPLSYINCLPRLTPLLFNLLDVSFMVDMIFYLSVKDVPHQP